MSLPESIVRVFDNSFAACKFKNLIPIINVKSNKYNYVSIENWNAIKFLFFIWGYCSEEQGFLILDLALTCFVHLAIHHIRRIDQRFPSNPIPSAILVVIDSQRKKSRRFILDFSVKQ